VHKNSFPPPTRKDRFTDKGREVDVYVSMCGERRFIDTLVYVSSVYARPVFSGGFPQKLTISPQNLTLGLHRGLPFPDPLSPQLLGARINTAALCATRK